jgi:hypothetical protein
MPSKERQDTLTGTETRKLFHHFPLLPLFFSPGSKKEITSIENPIQQSDKTPRFGRLLARVAIKP